LPEPDISLEVGSGSHAYQVGQVMIAYEEVLLDSQPDLVVVVGDVNATLACSITAKKLNIDVAHLEAGLRSYDMDMPEEINRLVTDSIVDYYWTPSIDANENLVRAGVDSAKISFVGNVMIDSLEQMRSAIELESIINEFELSKYGYAVATFHRPSNVDSKEDVLQVVEVLSSIASKLPIVIPIHPRTRQKLIDFDLLVALENQSNVFVTSPLSYKKFMALVCDAKFILTDSGGIQEESTYLGIPCLTFRDNTERPVTVEHGTNTLVDFSTVMGNVEDILDGSYKHGKVPLLWDGSTAERVVSEIKKIADIAR